MAGLFSSATGVGKAAGLVARTLQRQGATVTCVDITVDLGYPSSETSTSYLKPAQCRNVDASDIVAVLNPGSLRVDQLFDKKWLLGRCIIAHWIWEIERLPTSWKDDALSYDEIWGPTEFVIQSVRELLPDFDGQLRVVPYTIDFQLIPRPTTMERIGIRDRMQISRGTFVVGYSFASGSNYQRKNPEAAIRHFREAFPTSEFSVVLILRCRDLSSHATERHELHQLIANDKRMLLFDDKRTISIPEFYALIDLYLSPSRAEGFGLNLVEASQLEIPVITSGWRLAPEIARLPHINKVDYDLVPVVDPQGHYQNIIGARWSEPRPSCVVARLRALRDEYEATRSRLNHS